MPRRSSADIVGGRKRSLAGFTDLLNITHTPQLIHITLQEWLVFILVLLEEDVLHSLTGCESTGGTICEQVENETGSCFREVGEY